MVPTGVFLQELHEPNILKALAKASKVVESSWETPPPNEGITESPWVPSLLDSTERNRGAYHESTHPA
jgi:hypothetical protein